MRQTDSEAHVKADQAAPKGPPSRKLQDETVARTFIVDMCLEYDTDNVDTHGQSAGTEKGKKAQQAKDNNPMTGSEDAVKADRGDH